ncbi:hypothetical protein Bca101_025630 [Brassica carinata]
MGRGKIEIKRIENANNRVVTFSKRRNGLVKKAKEITVLCDAKVALIIFASNGKMTDYCCPSMDLGAMLDQYQKLSGKKLWDTKHENLSNEIDRIKKENDSLQLELRHLKGEDIQSLNLKNLMAVEHAIEHGLNKMEFLMTKRRNEKMLVEENRQLSFQLIHMLVCESITQLTLFLGSPHHPPVWKFESYEADTCPGLKRITSLIRMRSDMEAAYGIRVPLCPSICSDLNQQKRKTLCRVEFLKGVHCFSIVEVRLLRFWESRNVKRDGGLMGVDILLQGFPIFDFTVNTSPSFKSLHMQLYIDSVSRLVHCSEVTRCNQSFRMTASLLAIRFSDSTTFDELTGPLTPIRKERFRFRKFCCHEEYRILTCKTPTETIRSLRKLESLKRNSDSPLRRRMKLCEAKTLRSDTIYLLFIFNSRNNFTKRLIPLSHLSHSPTEPREAIMVVEEQPPQQQTPYLDDQIIEEAAEAVNVSPTARSLATAEVVAKASVSGEQRMVRRAAQKPVDDRLFMWAVVGITIATVVLLLKNFIRSSRFMEES